MKIGVTGTRSGMNDYQLMQVVNFLKEMKGSELHHGDCVGVDIQVARIAKYLGYKIICHPPIKNELRAYHDSDEIHEPLSYFARNRNIVDATDLLMVVPFQNEWQSSGGTWYTHDYALKGGKRIEVFYPTTRV